MNKYIYEDVDEFCEEIAELFYGEDVWDCNIVAEYTIAKYIINQLVSKYEFTVFDCVLIPGHDPFIIHVDADMDLSVGYAYDDGWVLVEDDEVCYVHSDVNSGFIKANDNVAMVEFDFCDGDCDKCHEYEEEDQLAVHESKNGITQSWSKDGSYFSRSFYSSNEDEIAKIKAEWSKFADRF